MSSKRKITINALSAVVQVTFTALLYFFLYKYLLIKLGVEQLGVWSLILSFSSIANLANFGITSGLVKFVAEYLVEKEEHKIGKLIFTSFVSMSVLFSIAGLLVFLLSKYFLYLVVDEQFLEVAFQILPYSLLSLILNAVSGIFTSVLEGFQKNYLRNFIYVFSGIVMFGLTLFLVPLYQLKGVAIAQLAQSLFVFFAALCLMLKINVSNRFSYWKWSVVSFKELFNYGYKFQIVSICQLLYEPTTKLLLSRFGGMAILGHYEMASRLVNQFRALLVNANQVVVPVIAGDTKTKIKKEIQEFYIKMNQILVLFTIPLSVALMVLAPAISIIWIGEFNVEFVFALVVLTISAMINILCGPSYFSCLAEGHLGVLVVTHFGMAVINLIIGYLLGLLFAGYGVISAWVIALSAGSIFLIYKYGKMISVNYFHIFSDNDKWLLGVSCLIIVVNFVLFKFTNIMTLPFGIVITFSLLLLYLPVIIKNNTVKGFIPRKI